MYQINPRCNQDDAQIIVESLKADGITSAYLNPGNQCISVSYGAVSAYYFVNDGKVVNIIFD
jgi:hypothetical protein